jgi:hypothetical protein
MKNTFHLALRVSAFVALLYVACAPTATAGILEHKTTFTVNQPIRVPGNVALPAGTYVIKRLDTSGGQPVVRITDPTETKIYATVFGIPEYLVWVPEKPQLTFAEVPAALCPR